MSTRRRLLLACLSSAAALPAWADSARATPAAARAMLAKAISYLKANGKEAIATDAAAFPNRARS
jgi:hypothetical protein